MSHKKIVLYWDTSAILPLLIEDIHTTKSIAATQQTRINFVSSLGVAEILGILSRIPSDQGSIKREEFLTDLQKSYWNLISEQPEITNLYSLSKNYKLRGADLWHLGVLIGLKRELPEIQMITFDQELGLAATKENILYQI